MAYHEILWNIYERLQCCLHALWLSFLSFGIWQPQAVKSHISNIYTSRRPFFCRSKVMSSSWLCNTYKYHGAGGRSPHGAWKNEYLDIAGYLFILRESKKTWPQIQVATCFAKRNPLEVEEYFLVDTPSHSLILVDLHRSPTSQSLPIPNHALSSALFWGCALSRNLSPPPTMQPNGAPGHRRGHGERRGRSCHGSPGKQVIYPEASNSENQLSSLTPGPTRCYKYFSITDLWQRWQDDVGW